MLKQSKIKCHTIFTLALFSSCFSSVSCLHFNLNVSNSTLSTLFSCCRDSTLFFRWSIWYVVEVRDAGPPSIELVSLSNSLALSAIVYRNCQTLLFCNIRIKIKNSSYIQLTLKKCDNIYFYTIDTIFAIYGSLKYFFTAFG